MAQIDHDRTYHVVRFADATESDAFVRALQRFLDSPRGEAFGRNARETRIWSTVAAGRADLYLSDGALLATEAGFAPVPAVEQIRGVEIPEDCVLVLEGAKLTTGGP